MAKKLKRWGSFGELVYKYRSKVLIVYLFFMGFIATGLAYAVVTGELDIFGTTNYTPGVSLEFTQAAIPSAGPDDTVSTSADGQTITFHLEFTDINDPKYVTFCIKNSTTMNFQLGLPATTGPTDPNVYVAWPNLDAKTILANTEVCDSDFRVMVYYTAESPADLTADMSMKVNYVQF